MSNSNQQDLPIGIYVSLNTIETPRYRSKVGNTYLNVSELVTLNATITRYRSISKTQVLNIKNDTKLEFVPLRLDMKLRPIFKTDIEMNNSEG